MLYDTIVFQEYSFLPLEQNWRWTTRHVIGLTEPFNGWIGCLVKHRSRLSRCCSRCRSSSRFICNAWELHYKHWYGTWMKKLAILDLFLTIKPVSWNSYPVCGESLGSRSGTEERWMMYSRPCLLYWPYKEDIIEQLKDLENDHESGESDIADIKNIASKLGGIACIWACVSFVSFSPFLTLFNCFYASDTSRSQIHRRHSWKGTQHSWYRGEP